MKILGQICKHKQSFFFFIKQWIQGLEFFEFFLDKRFDFYGNWWASGTDWKSLVATQVIAFFNGFIADLLFHILQAILVHSDWSPKINKWILGLAQLRWNLFHPPFSVVVVLQLAKPHLPKQFPLLQEQLLDLEAALTDFLSQRITPPLEAIIFGLQNKIFLPFFLPSKTRWQTSGAEVGEHLGGGGQSRRGAIFWRSSDRPNGLLGSLGSLLGTPMGFSGSMECLPGLRIPGRELSCGQSSFGQVLALKYYTGLSLFNFL